MKSFFDFKDDIHKCSKCGLCQSVCPVYKVTGNDCAVSRGKFIMLNGVIKGDLELNKNIDKYLDMCLKCNACKDFCPSDIDAKEIFLTAKAEYFNQGGGNSKFLKILNSRPIFKTALNVAKFVSNLYRFLRKFELGKKAILGNEILKQVPNYVQQVESKNAKQITVIYFKGCVNENINNSVAQASENVLKQMGVKILPINFECCGAPFLSNGNVKQFIKQAEFNISQIADDFDFFLTDCATCQSTFKTYENYVEDEKLLQKIKKINEKSLNIVDFVVKNAKSFEFEQKTTFTFHKPCHLENMNFLKEFLAKSKNIEYIEMKDFNVCCGFSGEFAIKNHKISEKISAEKAQNALNTNADYIVTSCPACVLGLNQGLIELGQYPSHVINFAALLRLSEIKL